MAEITPEIIFRVAELHRTIKEQAAEIERLRAYTDAYNTLLAERVEIECLRGLVVRAWHSFRSGGLTNADGMPRCLSDADIAELKRLADADSAKHLERDVLRDCRQGNQRCHECPDTECADNMADEAKTNNQKSIGEGR